jgi:5-methylthioadenosine/S-adenosylhomocysteine deaminase
MSILLKNIVLAGQEKDILIENNLIKKIGKGINVKADEKINAKGKKAVLPGLINSHTHSAMVLLRGYADDLPLKDWLEKKIWPKEAKMTEEDVYWGTKFACLEMLKSGTTTFNDMYWYPEAAVEAIKESGLRGAVGLTMIDFDKKGHKENIEKIHQSLSGKKISPIFLSVCPHSIYSVSKENLIWAKKFAEANNFILHIHLSETKKEVDDCLIKYNMRPVEFLDKIGFLDENCILAHSIWLDDNEIAILAKRKCSVVYNPSSNMKLASGFFPYEKIQKTGVNICLGTDGAASDNNLDMFEEMKFAGLLQKVKEGDPTVAPAGEIFKSATENGAKALKINSGEIKEGKLADLILADLNNINLMPNYDLISNLVYSARGVCISDVICNGKIMMQDRKVADEEKIKREFLKRI